MICKIFSFEHEDNGLCLSIFPETEVEEKILRGFWKFGKLELGYPSGDEDIKFKSNIGFNIRAWRKNDEPKGKN